MKSIYRRIACRLVGCVSALLLGSCTLTHKPPPMLYAGLPPAEKVHLKVALNLTDELRNTKWDLYAFGETDIWPVGQPLAASLPLFARRTFMDVVEINNSNLVSASVDAILTPKLPLVGFNRRSTTFSSDTINLKLEWTLAALNGDVIWADTATGESRTSSNWWRTFRLAMDQALGRSQRAMLASPAIRQFVLQKYPGLQTTIVTNRIADPDILDLCDALTSTDKGAVKDALKKLREIHAAEAVPNILPCLTNSQPDVVREACRTLAVLGDKNTIPNIEPLLTNQREDVRKDARQAIDKLNPDIAGLCKSLNSANQGELKNALKKLREIQATEAVSSVVPCLKDPDPGVVREACRTLAVLGNKGTIPNIEPLLNNPR